VPPPTPPRSSSPQLRNPPVSTAANQPTQSTLESSSRSTGDQQPVPILNAVASSSATNQHPVVPRSTNNQLSIENHPPCYAASNVDPDSPPPHRTQVSTRTDEQPLQPLTIRITNRGVSQRDGDDQVGGDESE
jgi:hypothetical protein